MKFKENRLPALNASAQRISQRGGDESHRYSGPTGLERAVGYDVNRDRDRPTNCSLTSPSGSASHERERKDRGIFATPRASFP